MHWTAFIRSQFAWLGKPVDDTVIDELAQHAAAAFEAARADGAGHVDRGGDGRLRRAGGSGGAH